MEILGKEAFDKLTELSNTPAVGKNKLDPEAIEADLKQKIKYLKG
jgi:hypothetical protein